ncbi:MAG: hypothetical protein ACKOYP_11360 [Bacteroidota bacterium]
MSRLSLIPVILAFLVTGCGQEREFLNPFDSSVDPDDWAPQSLTLTTTGFNSTRLEWKLKFSNIESLILVRSFAGADQEIILQKGAREYIDQSVRASGQPCGKITYSLRCKAGDKFSAVAAVTSSVDFPVLTAAQAGSDIQAGTRSVNLSANAPNTLESGQWTIVSGEGGLLSSTNNPTATFTGVAYRDYILRWTVSGVCGTGSDELNIAIKPLATVETSSVVATGGTSFSMEGRVVEDGGAVVTQRGVVYGTQPGPTISSGKVVSGGGPGTYTVLVSGLSSGVKYYLRAFATNNGGTAYGSELQVTTWSAPVVSTGAVSAVKAYSATVSGSVTSDGQSGVTERGIVWSTTQQPDLSASKVTAGSGTGDFSAVLSGLTQKTTYYVRAYAVNSVGTSYGAQATFTTTEPQPVLVETNGCSSTSGYTTAFIYWTGTQYAQASWTIAAGGYSGNCLRAVNPNAGNALGGYVEFSRTFSNPGYLRFWINTYNPGYNNRVPDVYVDGVLQTDPTMTAGNASAFYWMQLKTANIAAGTHTIRLDWTRVGQFYDYLLDEIELWELR